MARPRAQCLPPLHCHAHDAAAAQLKGETASHRAKEQAAEQACNELRREIAALTKHEGRVAAEVSAGSCARS